MTPGQDLRDGLVYVANEETALAVNVAIATERPLLLFGPSGCGKSSLAAYAAASMRWNYFEQVLTSRQSSEELLWYFDSVRRLRDAYAHQLGNSSAYVEPRILWWTFNLPSAEAQVETIGRSLPDGNLAPSAPGIIRGREHPSVVLLDEIDKADPDLPNNLLVALGSFQFTVSETGAVVKRTGSPLVIITSNDERKLPPTFLRRCVVHRIEAPSADRMIDIANAHFPCLDDDGRRMVEMVAARIVEIEQTNDGPMGPSTAEFLDAVRACLRLNVRPGESAAWTAIESAVLVKASHDG